MAIDLPENFPPDATERIAKEYIRATKWGWIFAMVLAVCVSGVLIADSLKQSPCVDRPSPDPAP